MAHALIFILLVLLPLHSGSTKRPDEMVRIMRYWLRSYNGIFYTPEPILPLERVLKVLDEIEDLHDIEEFNKELDRSASKFLTKRVETCKLYRYLDMNENIIKTSSMLNKRKVPVNTFRLLLNPKFIGCLNQDIINYEIMIKIIGSKRLISDKPISARLRRLERIEPLERPSSFEMNMKDILKITTGTCKYRYFFYIDRISSLIGRQNLQIIYKIYAIYDISKPKLSISSRQKVDRLHSSIAKYLISLDHPSLTNLDADDQKGFLDKFESIYNDEVLSICNNVCSLTKKILINYEKFIKSPSDIRDQDQDDKRLESQVMNGTQFACFLVSKSSLVSVSFKFNLYYGHNIEDLLKPPREETIRDVVAWIEYYIDDTRI